jgi:hypothetical protein
VTADDHWYLLALDDKGGYRVVGCTDGSAPADAGPELERRPTKSEDHRAR